MPTCTASMKRLAGTLAILVLALGCAMHAGRVSKSDTALAGAMIGRWQDTETGSVTTIALSQGTPTVVSVIDTDGEAFPVVKQAWDGRSLSYSYQVPSTGYVVDIITTGITDGVLSGTWSNTTPDGSHDSGTQDFQKLK